VNVLGGVVQARGVEAADCASADEQDMLLVLCALISLAMLFALTASGVGGPYLDDVVMFRILGDSTVADRG
jgi:hypothetical protein